MITFRILGPLRIESAGRDCSPSAPKLRQLLALLLVHVGEVVHIHDLVDELWEEDPPNTAVGSVRTYVYQLRRLLVAEGLDGGRLSSKHSGYVLRVAPETLDLTAARRLAAEGRSELAAGRPQHTARVLREALALWRGPALTGVPHGRYLRAIAAELDELRKHTLEASIRADLMLGRHRDVIGELRHLVASDPLDEGANALLIDALSRSGRRHDAFRVYEDVRKGLRDELGVDPGPELQQVRMAVLTRQRTDVAAAGAGSRRGADARAVPEPP
ncbi:AfsR/SARP family transcriptional regulator [Streptomonospora sp. PA3]|uniref:BTAD domain-containing putative transcriptional regulator n=1 Tax=Streptomonospora sp. PA3 TaxID=2607326 RepID=UPI001642C9EE